MILNTKARWYTISLFIIGLLSIGPTLAGQSTTYYYLDALGSPVAAADETGAVLWKERYRPYGERMDKETGAQSSTRWYTGHPEDSDTGLVYAGARYYDPIVGRFMGVDPVKFQEDNLHSFNVYAYGNNNPYRFVDPNGEWAEDLVLGIPSLILGGASLAENVSQGNWGWAAVDAVGIVVDIAAIATPGVPGGAGLGIKATRGAGSVVAKKPVVIGENMKDRVIPAAKQRGADYYKPRKTKGDPLKKNERWIDNKMREGREIIDIGPDPRRSKRSPFYEAEKRRIERRNYPVTK